MEGEIREEVEKLVAKFGEEWRQLIAHSIPWLRNEEPNWDLEEPIDGEEFVADLLDRAAKD